MTPTRLLAAQRWLAITVILIVSAADLWLIPPLIGDWALYLFLAIDLVVLLVVVRWLWKSGTHLPEQSKKR